MSQRLGMADGRCATILDSGRLFNESIYTKAGISVNDNLAYRRFLQFSDPSDIVPAATCSLYSYGDSSGDATNIISQNLTSKGY